MQGGVESMSHTPPASALAQPPQPAQAGQTELNGFTNGSLKHDLDDKPEPASLKKAHTAEADASHRESKSEPSAENIRLVMPLVQPEQKQASEPAPAAPTASLIVAPVAQHSQQMPQVSGAADKQTLGQSEMETPAINGASADILQKATPVLSDQTNTAETVAMAADVPKSVSPKDETKPITPQNGLTIAGNTEKGLAPSLPTNIDFGKSAPEAVADNNDDEEEEDGTNNEPVEPPMRKVEEDENYDEE